MPAGANPRYSAGAIASPSANGSAMPKPPMANAARTWLRLPSGARSSTPMMNMNRVTPSVPRPESTGSDAAGNTAACASGSQAPNTSGPSSKPAAISPITGGWPTWRSTAPQALAEASTSSSCSNSSSIALIGGRSWTQDACARRAGPHGGKAKGAPQHVDETVDRQAPGIDIRRRHARAVDIARVQRVAPVDHDPVVDAVDAADLFEQGRIPVDIARADRLLAPAFFLQGLEVGRMARGVDVFEAGRAMTIEGRSAPIPPKQVMHHGQAVGLHRIDVGDPLQEGQPLRRQRHQRVVARGEGEPPLRRQPEVFVQQRTQQLLQEHFVRQRRTQAQPGEQ